MKKCCLICAVLLYSLQARSQSQEVQQLLLNWEKLTQFRKILQNMYDGYKVLHTGYTTIKDISQGSFTLHKTFLDALLEVSPAVRNYQKIKDIIGYQLQLVKEYKAAYAELKGGGSFTAEEVVYMGRVYQNLLAESGKSLEALLLVMTSGSLRMNDEERLAAIYRIYVTVEDQLTFLKTFNSDAALLSLQRKSEKVDTDLSRKVFGF